MSQSQSDPRLASLDAAIMAAIESYDAALTGTSSAIDGTAYAASVNSIFLAEDQAPDGSGQSLLDQIGYFQTLSSSSFSFSVSKSPGGDFASTENKIVLSFAPPGIPFNPECNEDPTAINGGQLLVEELSHELGHVEDLYYPGRQYGQYYGLANFAAELISEGKAEYNNIYAEQVLDKPSIATSNYIGIAAVTGKSDETSIKNMWVQNAILYLAGSYGNEIPSVATNESYTQYYGTAANVHAGFTSLGINPAQITRVQFLNASDHDDPYKIELVFTLNGGSSVTAYATYRGLGDLTASEGVAIATPLPVLTPNGSSIAIKNISPPPSQPSPCAIIGASDSATSIQLPFLTSGFDTSSGEDFLAIAGNDQYNNTFYGEVDPNQSSYETVDQGFLDRYDVLIGGSGYSAEDNAPAPTSFGTQTFHAGSENNILIGGGGVNIFDFDNNPARVGPGGPGRGNPTTVHVVWGNGGNSTYEFSGAQNVVFLDVEDLTTDRLLSSSPDFFRSMLQLGTLRATPTTFILNAKKTDTLELDGSPLTGASYAITSETAGSSVSLGSIGFPDQDGNAVYQFGDTYGYKDAAGSNYFVQYPYANTSPINLIEFAAALDYGIGVGQSDAPAGSVFIENAAESGTLYLSGFTNGLAGINFVGNGPDFGLHDGTAYFANGTQAPAPDYYDSVDAADPAFFGADNTRQISLPGDIASTSPTSGSDHLVASSPGATLDGLGGDDFEQGLGGADTFIYKQGYGLLEIHEVDSSPNRDDVLLLGPGLTEAELTFRLSGGDLSVTDGVSGDEIFVDNQAESTSDGIDAIILSDGTRIDRAGIIAAAHLLTGTTGNDTLQATLSGTTFDGKGGDDTEEGIGGGDVFIFDKNYGTLTVDETGLLDSGVNTIAFGPGLAATDFTVSAFSSGLNGSLVLRDALTGDEVDIIGEFPYSESNGLPDIAIAAISFADSGSVTTTELQQLVQVPQIYYDVLGTASTPPSFSNVETSIFQGSLDLETYRSKLAFSSADADQLSAIFAQQNNAPIPSELLAALEGALATTTTISTIGSLKSLTTNEVISGIGTALNPLSGGAGENSFTLSGPNGFILSNALYDNIVATSGHSTITLTTPIITAPHDASIALGGGYNTVNAVDGNVSVTGVASGDQINLGNGDDSITGGGVGDTITVGRGNNQLDLGSATQPISGSNITVGSGTTLDLQGSWNTIQVGDYNGTKPTGVTVTTDGVGNEITAIADSGDLYTDTADDPGAIYSLVFPQHDIVAPLGHAFVTVEGGSAVVDDRFGGVAVSVFQANVEFDGFTADPVAQLNFFPYQGLTSLADVLKVLVPDGKGGSFIPIGTAGLGVDFPGVSTAALTIYANSGLHFTFEQTNH